ncbi:hypothetical protein SUGI_0621690 [Cryptomeria japonica]|nr:hypothetical protein SUGI_0621690 [Cryptomeria japonica]
MVVFNKRKGREIKLQVPKEGVFGREGVASPPLGGKGVSSFHLKSVVRVVPIRIATVPATITGKPQRSTSSSSSHGFFYPLLAIFQ